MDQGELLRNEKNHLLGHLTTLINQLQFNSVTGVGQELTAGEGAYKAIVEFHRYYEVLEASEKNKIPEALIQALNKLFLLASDPAANTLATGALSVDTCIATRRTDILNALRGHEVLLADIGLTGAQKRELIAENQRQITTLKNELKTQITEKKQANGHDSLGITRALLQTFDCSINLKTPEDVADLVCHLSPNEIAELCRDVPLRETIVTVIANLENLIMLYMQLSPERLSALNLAISDSLAKTILRSGNKLSMMLGLFDTEKKRLIIESFMPFKAANNSCYLRGLFSNPEAGVFEVMKEYLPGMIQTANDFCGVLKDLPPEQHTVVCNAMEARLPGMIQTADDFGAILMYLSPEQRTVVYNAMKARLLGMIQTAGDFGEILRYLSPEQRTAVYKAMEARLPGMIKTESDFCHILRSLSPEQSASLCTAIEARLPVIIQTVGGFRQILNYLSPEQSTALWSAVDARLPGMIRCVDHLDWILKNLSPEQCTAICTALEARLHVPIQTIIDNQGKISLSPESRISLHLEFYRLLSEKNFFQCYHSLYQQARNGFFGSLRRSTCNPQWNLNEILHDAKTHIIIDAEKPV